MTLAQFLVVAEDICNERLRMELSSAECARIFRIIDVDNDGVISHREFMSCFRRLPLLKKIAGRYQVHRDQRFNVASVYDFNKHTCNAHKHPDYKVDKPDGTNFLNRFDPAVHGEVYGEFADIRRKFDYSWHTNYSKERQEWQDHIIDAVARCQAPCGRPWLIFSCGAMGAGKTHVMNWLSKHNILPLEQLIHIDPDYFKRVMPEWDGYVAYDAGTAGTKCHKESGFMQEISQEVVLKAAQNVWIDGSLHDYVWYTSLIDDIRKKYPIYRIALFYVHCSNATVYERSARRGLDTGREIPHHLLTNAIHKTQKAVRILGPQVDLVVSIENEEEAPTLEHAIVNLQSFDTIRNIFLDARGPVTNAIAFVLPELRVRRDRELSENLSLPLSSDSAMAVVPLADPQCGATFHGAKLSDHLAEITANPSGPTCLITSTPAAITLDSYSRQVSIIPKDATRFAMCYGACRHDSRKIDWELVETCSPNALTPFLRHMSFLYFDDEGVVKGVNIVTVVEQDSRDSAQDGGSRGVLSCGKPEVLSSKFEEFLEAEQRWLPEAKPALVQELATSMAWLQSNELPNCPNGAIAYRLREGRAVYVPISNA